MKCATINIDIEPILILVMTVRKREKFELPKIAGIDSCIPLTSVAVGRIAQAVAVDPNSHQVWVANELDNNVSVITPSPNGYASMNVQVGGAPVAIAIDGSGKAYVANLNTSTLSIIDPATIIFCEHGYCDTRTVCNRLRGRNKHSHCMFF